MGSKTLASSTPHTDTTIHLVHYYGKTTECFFKPPHQKTIWVSDTFLLLYWKHFDLPTLDGDEQPGSSTIYWPFQPFGTVPLIQIKAELALFHSRHVTYDSCHSPARTQLFMPDFNMA